MSKKWLITLLTVTFLFSIYHPVWSSVEGIWDINGKTTVKVTIKGYGTEKETTFFEDEFIFYNDNTFEMIDSEGTWSQERRKFNVYIDPADLEDYFEDNLEYMLDTDVDVYITSYSFYGSEDKSSHKIKGKMKMNMSLYIDEYDIEGTINVNTTFTGYRSYEYFPAQKTEESNMISSSPMENILNTIDYLLRTP
ncbi:MAG: hypothetical protein RDU01_09640 [Thermodesulfovibrionales bacterium]|nr:hypothetical protein [Thermodesulfovibrionales bacterium]